jgi:hypothetical protein
MPGKNVSRTLHYGTGVARGPGRVPAGDRHVACPARAGREGALPAGVMSSREDLDMTLLSAQSLAWLGVVAAVLMVLAAPVLIAAIRGAEPISLVVLLTVLALGTGPVTWVPALIAAFALPPSRSPSVRNRRAAPRSGSPPASAPWR